MAAMRSRIGLIAVAFSFSALRLLVCTCAGGDPDDCQVPVGDIIVRATVVSKEESHTRPSFAARASRGAPQPGQRPTLAMPQPEPWGVKITLSVSERFRGSSSDSLVVRTEPGEAALVLPRARTLFEIILSQRD